jgi:hypothetical protein
MGSDFVEPGSKIVLGGVYGFPKSEPKANSEFLLLDPPVRFRIVRVHHGYDVEPLDHSDMLTDFEAFWVDLPNEQNDAESRD